MAATEDWRGLAGVFNESTAEVTFRRFFLHYICEANIIFCETSIVMSQSELGSFLVSSAQLSSNTCVYRQFQTIGTAVELVSTTLYIDLLGFGRYEDHPVNIQCAVQLAHSVSAFYQQQVVERC